VDGNRRLGRTALVRARAQLVADHLAAEADGSDPGTEVGLIGREGMVGPPVLLDPPSRVGPRRRSEPSSHTNRPSL